MFKQTNIYLLYFQAIDSYGYNNAALAAAAANPYYTYPYNYVPTTLSGTTPSVPPQTSQTYVLDLPPVDGTTGKWVVIATTLFCLSQ